MTQIIKSVGTERLAENDAAASNLTGDFLGSTDANNTIRYQEVAEDYLLDNNGILTQGAANVVLLQLFLVLQLIKVIKIW